MNTTLQSNYYCLLLAGGLGTRMWPLSRKSMPKQFLQVDNSGKSYLQIAYERCRAIFPQENILVVTTSQQRRLVLDQLPDLPFLNLLVEPYQRDTGVAMAYGAYVIKKRDPNAVMLVSPVDVLISDNEQFASDVSTALGFALNNDYLLVFGVVPDHPDVNYGYIQVTGGPSAISAGTPVKVKTVTQKPEQEIAEIFCRSGEFLWNSSFFVWNIATIVPQIKERTPAVYEAFVGFDEVWGTVREQEFLNHAYSKLEKTRIDRGFLEGNPLAYVYPCSCGWTDVGNWDSIYNFIEKKDKRGNVVMSGKCISKDSHNNLIIGSGKFFAISGLDNYVIVDTPEALLICPKDSKKIKELTTSLSRPEYEKYK